MKDNTTAELNNKVLKSGSHIFYGGDIDGVMGDISFDSLDKILDLIDDYIDILEAVN